MTHGDLTPTNILVSAGRRTLDRLLADNSS
jgi:tRNA A-37 threonylcarbamoyl transferase component Bud32